MHTKFDIYIFMWIVPEYVYLYIVLYNILPCQIRWQLHKDPIVNDQQIEEFLS